MARVSGNYRISSHAGEQVRAFVPGSLPPRNPPLEMGALDAPHAAAQTALARLAVAGGMLSSPGWFIYGFVRKEAVLTSQIEGTQATLMDLVTYEATRQTERPDDVREVCNYIDALEYAREQIASPAGLPLSTRLLCGAHKRLMRGVRGKDKLPGEVRRSQNWIGGTRPGNARFVPPPPELVPELLGDLERWMHAADPLPPIVRAGLAHVQFETIHPFLDGNGRMGRLLITLLLEHWGVLSQPVLYLSLAIRRRQREYYDRLTAVRDAGDWEGWTRFYLECVIAAADEGVSTAQQLSGILGEDRVRVTKRKDAGVAGVRLLDALPSHPILTASSAVKLLRVSKPTAIKAISSLEGAGVLREISGRARDRVYAYSRYLDVLTRE
jgi:Fic family protein